MKEITCFRNLNFLLSVHKFMPYLNGDDLGETERTTKFNLLVNEIIYLVNENLLMSSNRNAQGIGYSQPQNKLLETYPKMLKEPHNLQRKHRPKGPLSVLTTTISDRRKRRERFEKKLQFDQLKKNLEGDYYLVQEVELIMKKNISDMCECLKSLCRKLKKEISINHLMDLVQYLGPDTDCLFIKEYSSLEDIAKSIYYGPCLWVENTFSLGDCIIQISKNQCEKFEKLLDNSSNLSLQIFKSPSEKRCRKELPLSL
ncbi:hypothetical protein Avbf_14134 [Armadillidium vulgare]|nr:hypothetical protein Avbf_14134 [Armadillidium vulgare]